MIGFEETNPERNGEPALLTAKEVARWLRVSTRQVWRLLSGGQLPAPVRLGGAVRWRTKELRSWLEEGCPEVRS